MLVNSLVFFSGQAKQGAYRLIFHIHKGSVQLDLPPWAESIGSRELASALHNA